MYTEILMEKDDIIYILFYKVFPNGLDTLNVKVVKTSHITTLFFYLKCIIYINDDTTNGLR